MRYIVSRGEGPHWLLSLRLPTWVGWSPRPTDAPGLELFQRATGMNDLCGDVIANERMH